MASAILNPGHDENAKPEAAPTTLLIIIRDIRRSFTNKSDLTFETQTFQSCKQRKIDSSLVHTLQMHIHNSHRVDCNELQTTQQGCPTASFVVETVHSQWPIMELQ